jgi:hypothetical protein
MVITTARWGSGRAPEQPIVSESGMIDHGVLGLSSLDIPDQV